MLLKDFKKDKLSVRVFDNRTAMGEDSAAAFAKVLREMLAKKDAVNIIFAAAPSQSDFLAALERESDIDWKRVNVFHMDEYIGIGNDHPQSFARFVKTFVADRFAVAPSIPCRATPPMPRQSARATRRCCSAFPPTLCAWALARTATSPLTIRGSPTLTIPRP